MLSEGKNDSINNDNIENNDFIDLKDNKTNSSSASFEINNDGAETTQVLTSDSINKSHINKKVIWFSLLGIIAILGLIYLGGVFYFKNHFVPNTHISGFNSSFQTPESVNEKLTQISKVRKVTLKGKDEEISDIKAQDIGLNLTDSINTEEILKEQNPYQWPLYLFNVSSNNHNQDHSIDENALNQKISELSIVAGPQVIKTENARADYNGTDFEVKDEIYGTEVNTEILKDIVKNALENGESEVNLEENNCYVLPSLTKDNQNLKDNIDKLNNALNSVITYDFKVAQEVLDKNTFAGWLSTDAQGNMTVSNEQAAAYIQTLKDKYDTLGKDLLFKTSSGKDITVTSEFTGWEIDAEQELPALEANILSGQPIVKEPIYSSTGGDRSQGNRISGTYLEISIGDQTMWLYNNNQLVVSTPVVTGDTSEGYGTPTGLYEIQAKSTDVVLTGNNSDGSRYESPVTYWMPFNGGIGVHDATWRSSFGGSIFRGNGSHGCVNTPYGAAQTIYNNISVSDPVVVY